MIAISSADVSPAAPRAARRSRGRSSAGISRMTRALPLGLVCCSTWTSDTDAS
jgi:hypothetical protein